ncbi:DUF808 domain-containing protein [Marinobacter sp. M1N3S26]|uniref:DUF808 domain-containing protein n=1 Tax=Marinobacter sp. M1N3S26 TaxID=3382299 RepID=UPI00387AB30F
MAGASLLTLLDDISVVLDDVSVMTKVAAKKTAGVLGDDLALNAQQVTGVRPARELPVVWAVAKGSAINKVILVPLALAISYFLPWLITPLLMLGGAFLCYEGFEKLVHKWLHREQEEAHREDLRQAMADPQKDLKALEKDKIKGAIRTDFILSAEIIAITLGTVSAEPITMQLAVLVVIAVAVTVGVYGMVAAIVKLDDLGVHLTERESSFSQSMGAGILRAAPWLMKTLSIVGTAAMFLVGGGILVHGIHPLYEWIREFTAGLGSIMATVGPMLIDGLIGVLAGAVLVAVISGAQRLRA